MSESTQNSTKTGQSFSATYFSENGQTVATAAADEKLMTITIQKASGIEIYKLLAFISGRKQTTKSLKGLRESTR